MGKHDPGVDDIFRANAARRPEADALIDPPDREAVTGQAPRRFTYAQADRAIGAIAARLRQIGLPAGTVVGIQMPNVAESILTLLAVLRAGMIAAPLPLLWRRAECASALSRAGARALFVCGRVGDVDHAQLALDIAAELFPIRAVCGFGCGRTEGIVPFDDLLSGETELAHAAPASDEPQSVAVITFDMLAEGPVPIRRTHAQLLAAGWLVRDRAAIESADGILSTIPAASFGGLVCGCLPWLLCGGTLALHHPFSPDTLASQIEHERCGVLAVPAAVLTQLGEAGTFDRGRVRSVLSLWRSPERLASAPQWLSEARLVDIAAFGELGVLSAVRPADGRVAPWSARQVAIAHDGRDMELARIVQTPAGTLGIYDALAAAPSSDGVESLDAPDGGTGTVDTGYPCRPEGDGLVVTGAPPGLVNVGGYRFAARDLQGLVREADRDAVLAALPHALSGYRLAGHAAQPDEMRQSLSRLGVNPLVCDAFRVSLPPE